tara:strand:+ start:1047 stop:1250 length:204 start_codon:yes stop_codon:yes gene_type:complete
MSIYKVVLQGPQGQQEAFFKSFKQAMLFFNCCDYMREERRAQGREPITMHPVKLEKVQKEIKLPSFL